MHEGECAAEQLVALRAAHVAEELHGVPVDVRFDPFAKVGRVVRDAGDLQPYAGTAGDLDGEVRAFLGMEAREEEQIVAGPIDERERVGIDAIVGSGEIVEARVAIGVADRAVKTPRRTRIVRREDRRREKPWIVVIIGGDFVASAYVNGFQSKLL